MQAMRKPFPHPGQGGNGDPISELTNWLYGTAARSSLVAVLGNNHLYEDNYGERRENSTKAVSRRAPSAACWVQPWQLPGCLQSLPVGTLPSCRQRAHSHSGNWRQRSTGTGGAPVVWLSQDASSSSAAQGGGSPMLPRAARGMPGQSGRTAGAGEAG